MQKDTYSLFVDNSGSVSGSENYWTTVSHVINSYAKDITHYFLWNSKCFVSSLKEMEECIKKRMGTGGTAPTFVAETITIEKMQNIILITDGQVGDHDVKGCDVIFDKAMEVNKFHLKKSVCYIVSTDNGELNMSVTCPFTRFCESKVFTKRRNEDLKKLVSYTKEDYKILDSLEQISLQNFESKYDMIEGLIISLNMGKEGNIPLKNQLVVMKNRLVKELSHSMKKQFDHGAEMRITLEKNDFQSSIKLAAEMSKKYFENDSTTDIEKNISHLINLCGDLRGKYNIGQIKSNKMAIAQTAKEAKLDLQVEVQDLSKNPIECPIIMDEDVPQILIDQCEPFLLGVEKHIVDDISACPLRILNYPELKAKFKATLSTFIGVKYADKMHKNPFTQNRLLGGIPLGTHKSHVEVGNYTIAKMISGGKILGNLNMYYAVIWYLITEDEIQYLSQIKANATQHLIYRLKNSTTMAGLCGLAQFVTTNVPSDVAVWYCVHSGYLNQPTDRDTFRFHFMNLKPMIKMVRALGYPLHEGTKAHYLRTKALMSLLGYFKKLSTNDKKILKNNFKALYQKGFFLKTETISEKVKELEVCVNFIPVDGEPTAEQIDLAKKILPQIAQKLCEQLSTEQAYYISTLLDAQKSASDIFLDYNIKVPPLPKAEVNWIYGTEVKDPSKVQFCPKTLRPYYYVEDNTWETVAKNLWKIDNTNVLFKGCKYMENFILKFEKIPDYSELVVFYYNRYVQSGKETTLPYLTEIWAQELLEKFIVAAGGKEIAQVIQILNKTRPKQLRIQIEKGQ